MAESKSETKSESRRGEPAAGGYATREREVVDDPEQALEKGFFGTRPEGYKDEDYMLTTGPNSPPPAGESGGGVEDG